MEVIKCIYMCKCCVGVGSNLKYLDMTLIGSVNGMYYALDK
jgi:hypothetical protein